MSLVLFMLSGPVAQISAADGNTGATGVPEAVSARYQEAKDYYYLLIRDKTIQNKRANWQRGIRDFRRIYLDDPKGALAPRSLFMMAKMYYRMYMKFHNRSDLDESIAYYNNIWTIFPENSLADDALYWSAEIYRKDKNNPTQAAKLLKTQVMRFPHGDRYAQALNRLRELDAAHGTGLPRELTDSGAMAQLAKVLPVQYWSSDDYTRIVIRSSAPVTYTSSLLTGKENKTRRLHIDFNQSTIEEKYTTPVPVREGILRRIHSSRLDPSTVRVALEVTAISSYKIFSLDDPFRVIVDVRAPRKTIATSKPLPRVGREKIPAARRNENPSPVTPELKATRKRPVAPGTKSLSHTGRPETFIVLDEMNKWKPGTPESPAKGSPPRNLSLAQQLGLGVSRIVIDPGHGGKDPGAMAFDLREKDITLRVARKTANLLRDRHGYEVIMTRKKDRSMPLEERTAIANTSKADLFISIHVNAHPRKSTRGVETFFLNLATNTEAMRVAARENATSSHNISDLQDILSDLMQNSKIQESSVLADYVQNSLVSGLRQSNYPTRDLGVKQAPFYVLIGAEMPAILAEISFISNPEDARRLKEEAYLDEIARRIAAGVAGYVEHQTTAALRL